MLEKLKKVLLLVLVPFTTLFFLTVINSCKGFFITCTGDINFPPYTDVEALLVINKTLFTAISILVLLLHWYLIMVSFSRKVAVSIVVLIVTFMELPVFFLILDIKFTMLILMNDTTSLLWFLFLLSLIPVAYVAYKINKHFGKRFEKPAMITLAVLVIVVSYLIIKYTLHPLGEKLVPVIDVPF